MVIETVVQKLGDDLIINLPKEVIEKLNLEEGCIVDIEPFICGGISGIRIKLKEEQEKMSDKENE